MVYNSFSHEEVWFSSVLGVCVIIGSKQERVRKTTARTLNNVFELVKVDNKCRPRSGVSIFNCEQVSERTVDIFVEIKFPLSLLSRHAIVFIF